MGVSGCLADEMGLGKTVQVQRHTNSHSPAIHTTPLPCLNILPPQQPMPFQSPTSTLHFLTRHPWLSVVVPDDRLPGLPVPRHPGADAPHHRARLGAEQLGDRVRALRPPGQGPALPWLHRRASSHPRRPPVRPPTLSLCETSGGRKVDERAHVLTCASGVWWQAKDAQARAPGRCHPHHLHVSRFLFRRRETA